MMACGESKTKSEEQAFLESLDSAEAAQPEISEEVISDIMQQIPSPLEISVLLKESGTDYNKGILNNSENTDRYNSSFKQALNLGIYGTDLGYTNIYEQNQDGIFYLNSIKTLADALNIGQFFDFSTIRKLAANSQNLDSLLLITTMNFNNINHYLQSQDRANLSVLLLTGGWLEALHISCQIYEEHPNQDLRDKIGEQKIIMENILLLLSAYQGSDPNIASLNEDLAELQEEFNKIEIVYTYQESTFEEIDGVLVIKDNSTTEINITDENIDNITRVTDAIREKIIS
jgi:hypothetical protein